MLTLVFAAALLAQGPAAAPAKPDPDAKAKAQFREWAKINAEAYTAAQKLPKAKRAKSYNSALLKRNQEFCRKYAMTLPAVESLILKGVDAKWPADDDEQLKMVVAAAANIRALRAQGDALREQAIFEQEMAAYIEKANLQRRATRPKITSAAGLKDRIQTAPPSITAADVPVSNCGHATEDGGKCRRKVAGGGFCYQHR